MAASFVGQKYQISRRIGGGSFGEIYLGTGPNSEKVRNYELFFPLNSQLIYL